MTLKNTPNLSDVAQAFAKFAGLPSVDAAEALINQRTEDSEDKKRKAEARREAAKNRRKGDYMKGINDASVIAKGFRPSKLKTLPKCTQEILVKNLLGAESHVPAEEVNLPIPTEEMEKTASPTELDEVKKINKAVRKTEKQDAAPPLTQVRKPKTKKTVITIVVKKLLKARKTTEQNVKRFVSRHKLQQLLKSQTNTTPAPDYVKNYFAQLSILSQPMSRNFALVAIAYAQGLITKKQFQKYFVLIPLAPSDKIQVLLNKKFQWL